MITVSFLTVILFLGGWDFPFLSIEQTGFIAAIAKLVVILVKVSLVILFMMWVRWTLPRFRYDQLMDVAWKSLIPLAIVNFGRAPLSSYRLSANGPGNGSVWVLEFRQCESMIPP